MIDNDLDLPKESVWSREFNTPDDIESRAYDMIDDELIIDYMETHGIEMTDTNAERVWSIMFKKNITELENL